MARESQTAAKAPQSPGESLGCAPLERLPLDASDAAVLRAVVEGTVHSTGEEFFQSLVRNLATAIDVRYAFVAEFTEDNTRVRTLAYWSVDQAHENVEYQLEGTPCEDVVRGNLCHYPRGVKEKFPRDLPLVELEIESYLGVPLLDSAGATLGHLAVFDPRPMSDEPRRVPIFQIFAARAAAELARLRAERALRESKERYRDLFEEAPIAYVNEDLESRFISANRAAMEILGIKPEEVAGMMGMSLVPDTSDARRNEYRKPSRRLAVERRPEASFWSSAGKTMANRFGFNGGPGPIRAAATRARCSWTSPIAYLWSKKRPGLPPRTSISRKKSNQFTISTRLSVRAQVYLPCSTTCGWSPRQRLQS